MVFTCSAINCRNTNSLENRAKRITFHRFPRDGIKRTAWALATRRQGFEKGTLWKPSKYSVLCSNHFLEEDFDDCPKLRRLKEGVIPTVFDFPNSNIKVKVPVIQQIQKKTEHSYFRKCYVKSKVPAIKQRKNKAIKNKKTLTGPKKKTLPLPSFNIQENSNALVCDEVFDMEAIETPLILLSQNEASKNKETLPSQKKKTVPLPSHIQEDSNTIECDEVSNINAKAPVITQSQEKDSQNEATLPCQNEKTVPLCSTIIPSSSNIHEHSNVTECQYDEINSLKRNLEAAETKNKDTYKKLCSTRAILSRKEKKIEELLNNLEEQKKLYESLTKERETTYTDRSTNLQIELITRKPGVKFSEELITFAKTVRGISPKAYNFLRDTLNLPHERTLRQKKDNIDDKCTELPTRTFQVLGEESQKYVATGNKYCRLMVDGKVVNALMVKKYVE